MSISFEKEDVALYKSTVVGAVPGFLAMLLFWVVAYYSDDYSSFVIKVLVFVGGFNLCVWLWGKQDLIEAGLNMVWLLLFLALGSILNSLFGGWGLLGFVLVVVVMTLVLLWRRRKQYMSWLRHIETKLYGAPLDEIRKREGKL